MPSTLLDARSITRHHGARTILQDVDVRVDATTRLALIGPNGSGKSTLLRALAGIEPLDGGTVQRFGTVGYLPQLADHRGAATVRATILERLGVAGAARVLDACRHGWPVATSTRSARTPRRWSAGWRSAAPTPRRASPRRPTSSASQPRCSTARWRRSRAARRRVPGSRSCAPRASTSSRSTSRPTTSTTTAWSG